MSTEETLRTVTNSSETTEELGEHLANNLRGGEIIELVSDLGGGKTTFVRGMGRGIHSGDHVSSPTFTISQIYKGKTLQIHHFDFYRISDEPGIIQHELEEAFGDNRTVTVIEWPNVVENILPAERLTINITTTTNENERDISFAFPAELSYLLENVC